jgi:hypothetical protein
MIAICAVAAYCHKTFRDHKLRHEIEAKRSVLLFMNNYYTSIKTTEHRRMCFLMFPDKDLQNNPVFQSFEVFARIPTHGVDFQWTAEKEGKATIFRDWLRELQRMIKDRTYKRFIDPSFKFQFTHLGDAMHFHLTGTHTLIKVHEGQNVCSQAYDDVLQIFATVFDDVQAAERNHKRHQNASQNAS